MKTLKLPKSKLDFFAAVIQQFGEVHAPVARGDEFAFERLERWSDARLDYNRTILPPKKYFLPPREEMFTYTADGYVPSTEGLDQKLVLFGVHACDVYGLNILDEVFLDGPHPDPYYKARRRNVAVIGIDCIPDENCFCRSMRADFVDKGFDLFFYDMGDAFFTLVGTALGDDMVLSAASLFEPVAPQDVAAYKAHSQAKAEMFKLDVEIRDLPEIFEMEYTSAIWEELGEKCLACGACSMVCPTCYCYDVQDTVKLGECAGSRERCWDTCLFSSHARVAGGENFREEQSDRIKFRFYHKQRGFVAEYGRPSCIGCGRCIVSCPVDIHVVEVLNRLRGVAHVA
jgi:sulfhydrogenase subunit beta (sulfur reductase)